MRQMMLSDTCYQRKLKSACASAQSDQRLRFSREETLHQMKTLIRSLGTHPRNIGAG